MVFRRDFHEGRFLSNRSCTDAVIFGDLRKQDDDSSGERKKHVSCISWVVPLLLQDYEKCQSCCNDRQ